MTSSTTGEPTTLVSMTTLVVTVASRRRGGRPRVDTGSRPVPDNIGSSCPGPRSVGRWPLSVSFSLPLFLRTRSLLRSLCRARVPFSLDGPVSEERARKAREKEKGRTMGNGERRRRRRRVTTTTGTTTTTTTTMMTITMTMTMTSITTTTRTVVAAVFPFRTAAPGAHAKRTRTRCTGPFTGVG